MGGGGVNPPNNRERSELESGWGPARGRGFSNPPNNRERSELESGWGPARGRGFSNPPNNGEQRSCFRAQRAGALRRRLVPYTRPRATGRNPGRSVRDRG